jgi:hypothetical protein
MFVHFQEDDKSLEIGVNINLVLAYVFEKDGRVVLYVNKEVIATLYGDNAKIWRDIVNGRYAAAPRFILTSRGSTDRCACGRSSGDAVMCDECVTRELPV